MIGTGLQDECASSGAYGFMRHAKMQRIASYTRGGPGSTTAQKGSGSSKLHGPSGQSERGRRQVRRSPGKLLGGDE